MTKSKESSVEKFVETEIADLKRFILYWRKNQKKYPENFPEKMGYGEWAEQFNNFQGIREE